MANECNVSLKAYFPNQNKKKRMHDPTNVFSVIPSWNREFVCLIGLEEVVLFRFERLDKTVFTAPNKHRTRGRPKKIPIPAVVPATLPKDPYTCVKCNTDVSCSWKFDVNCSILCHSCVKCSWRKYHWLSSGPTETIIKSNSNNSSILTSSSNAVWNEPQSLKETAFPLQHSSRSIPQECDQQVLKNSLSSSSNFHPDSPSCLCSPLSSDLSSSPPDYCSDTSHWSSSISSDHCFSSDSSSSCGLSSCGLCNGSSSSCLPSSSDLSSSSSSMTPSASGSPPKNSSKWVLQKVKTPYWMETPLARALFKDDKAEKKKEKEKEEQLTKSKCKEEKTGKMAALSVPSLSSNQQILPKTRSALPDSEQSSSPLLRFSSYTRILLIPNYVVQQPGKDQTSGEVGSSSKSEAKNLHGVSWQPSILLLVFFFFFFIGQTEKVNQQVLVSPNMKIYTTKIRSTPNGKPCDPK
ncbi:uncharacterized protein LOC128610680 [Ictalurus furcatus]|uniref:uncharacterized protein LOC128610680 n=1 Tax=Ictalurus furcatus TaxID=66913 RepID=UPI002350C0BB|nr:uncharacterized protein LOC128610680 [Ictalurus furcatus]